MAAIERLVQLAENSLSGYTSRGNVYRMVGNSGSISAGSSWYISFVIPAGKQINLVGGILASTANLATVSLVEGATFTAGTAYTPQNANRNYPNASKVTVTTNATSIAGGTTLASIFAGTAGQSGLVLVDTPLRPDTTYILQFTVIGATTASTMYYDIGYVEV